MIFGYEFELLKYWGDSHEDPWPLFALSWGSGEFVPKKRRRPSYLLDFRRHRTHSKWFQITVTWLRIQYVFNFEKVIKVYTKEELLESQ